MTIPSASFDTVGSGPPLLLLSPGGFDGRRTNWTEMERYERMGLLERLSRSFTCITFDKLGSGASPCTPRGMSWQDYAAQGLALLDHLGYERIALLGGCVGASVALQIAVTAPQVAEAIVCLYPAGGPRYRRKQVERLRRAASIARQDGLSRLNSLVRDGDIGLPWQLDGVLAQGADSEAEFVARLLESTHTELFPTDAVPGPTSASLATVSAATLVISGNDDSHARSAAHYLWECVDGSRLIDPVCDDVDPQDVSEEIVDFLVTACQ